MSSLTLKSRYGHMLYLGSAPANAPIHEVCWSANSIGIPSDSVLNQGAMVRLCPAQGVREEKARVWCGKNKVEFVCCTAASVTFRVKGFSRYRYVESDDEEEQGEEKGKEKGKEQGNAGSSSREKVRNRTREAGRTPMKKKLGQESSRKGKIGVGNLLEEDENEEEEIIDMEEVKEEKEVEFGGRVVEGKWEMLEQGGMKGIGCGLFEEDDDDEKAGDSVMQDVEAGDMVDVDVEEEMWRRIGGGAGEETDVEDNVVLESGEFGGQEKGGEGLFPKKYIGFVGLDKSICAEKVGYSLDMGVMLGRTSRMSFNHCGVAVESGWGRDVRDPFGVPVFEVRLGEIYHGGMVVPRNVVCSLLRVHCTAWHARVLQEEEEEEEEEGEEGRNVGVRVPNLRGVFDEGNEAVGDDVLRSIVEELKVCFEAGDRNAVHAHVAFELIFALYKKGRDVGDGGEDSLLKRLSEWACGAAGSYFDMEENCKASGLRLAFIHMSLGKIELAVETAIQAGHLRLGLLIGRSLESHKDDLRCDAAAQLAAYELIAEDGESDGLETGKFKDWDLVLEECSDKAAVCIDERLILMTLAGEIGAIGRFLHLSWYRVFILELFHGKISWELTQAERISWAVEAVQKDGVSTLAPHECEGFTDVVYHLLRLYADPTGGYSLTSGVYSNGSFGKQFCPLDARFSWMLYQVMSGIVAEGGLRKAGVMLADEFATQLRAGGLHVWGFYVLCSGNVGEKRLKEELMRDWGNIEKDFVEWDVDVEKFLNQVLHIPMEWISEAKAMMAHEKEDYLKECSFWLQTKSEQGNFKAHEILRKSVFPNIICNHSKDSKCQLETLETLLLQLSERKFACNWSIGGGLMMDYLKLNLGKLDSGELDLRKLQDMMQRVKMFSLHASSDEEYYCSLIMGDGILEAERCLLFGIEDHVERNELLTNIVQDLANAVCNNRVRMRIMEEVKVEAQFGSAISGRVGTTWPPYRKWI